MKNELGMKVPSSVCKKAKEKGCHHGVKYVYMDGDYGGKFPASSLGDKKGTRFEDIDSANAYKIDLGSGWVAFTSPLNDDMNAFGDGSGKQNNDTDLKLYVPSSKKESNIVESLGSKATDFERRLHEATKIWKEKEEQKRNQLEGDELLETQNKAESKQSEEELLKGLNEAESKQLEEELLKGWDEAKSKQSEEELLKEWDAAENKQLEEELLKEWDAAENEQLEEELLEEWGEAESKQHEEKKVPEDQVCIKSKELDEDLLEGSEKKGIRNPDNGEFREDKKEPKMKHPEKEKFRKEPKKAERKSPVDKKFRKEQGKAKKNTQEPATGNKSKKRGLIMWAGIIVAVSLFICFVAIPLTDNSEEISLQNLGVLNEAPTVIATENNNDTFVREEMVIVSEEPPKNFTNSIGMKFVLIPEGEFLMGSPDNENGRYYEREGPIHEVTIENDYYLGKYEVTQKQWVMVMGSNPSHSTGDNRPVEKVSWYEVQEFISKLNSMEGTDKYRLPSEAEWEYACRAGTNTRYHFGNNESFLDEYAWYTGYIYSVGHLRPNNWGLYDMHGNVYEFVQDEWHSGYEGAPEVGDAWEDGSSDLRTLRSGSLNGDTDTCRSASRTSIDPDLRLSTVGFRLAMDV